MAKEIKQVNFDEFAVNLDKIFDALAREKDPVLIEKGGRLYRLEAAQKQESGDIWVGYDPDAVRRGLMRSAGALAGVDGEALLRDIHQAREQASSGRSS